MQLKASRYPFLISLPVLLRTLVVQQIHEALRRLKEGDIGRVLQYGDECECEFFSTYSLPCQHIFIADEQNGYLSEDLIDTYISTFEESGIKVYENWETVTMPIETDVIIFISQTFGNN